MMTKTMMMTKGKECGEAARGGGEAHSRLESEHDSTDTMVAH